MLALILLAWYFSDQSGPGKVASNDSIDIGVNQQATYLRSVLYQVYAFHHGGLSSMEIEQGDKELLIICVLFRY
jgi:hypothetical protein